MNILITNESWPTHNWAHVDWCIASDFFTPRKLLHAIATLTMIQNDESVGEDYDSALDETIAELICKRIDDEDEENPAPGITDAERNQIARYLKDAVRALRPYMPSGGSLELITYISEPEKGKLYLVVRYHPEDEHSGTAFANPSLRG